MIRSCWCGPSSLPIDAVVEERELVLACADKPRIYIAYQTADDV